MPDPRRLSPPPAHVRKHAVMLSNGTMAQRRHGEPYVPCHAMWQIPRLRQPLRSCSRAACAHGSSNVYLAAAMSAWMRVTRASMPGKRISGRTKLVATTRRCSPWKLFQKVCMMCTSTESSGASLLSTVGRVPIFITILWTPRSASGQPAGASSAAHPKYTPFGRPASTSASGAGSMLAVGTPICALPRPKPRTTVPAISTGPFGSAYPGGTCSTARYSPSSSTYSESVSGRSLTRASSSARSGNGCGTSSGLPERYLACHAHPSGWQIAMWPPGLSMSAALRSASLGLHRLPNTLLKKNASAGPWYAGRFITSPHQVRTPMLLPSLAASPGGE
mmetsp:Transcript_7828/g.23533  ORF Transcript_7828/g.23533 Transcript_7828/m.23533 type:complete len:334 (+) Transcript_7828:2908-3909(+)